MDGIRSLWPSFWGLYLGELSIVARVIGLWQLLQVGLGGPALGLLCALLKGMLKGMFVTSYFDPEGMLCT